MIKPLSPSSVLLAVLWAAVPAAAPRAADLPPQDAAFLRMYFTEEQLVESPTRAPKPLSQVAENVTVVTAQEIEDMNAHTLAEVLDRVTGVFVQFFGNHFGAIALPHVQGSGETDFAARGSDDRHALILVDGVPWSSQTSGPFLSTIPVGIIERIEIIKGPASSAWGSSLGGVVNVLTKRPGTADRRLHGALYAAGGERSAYDTRAEVSGTAGPFGYYLQSQGQNARWDDAGASFSSRSAFARTEARVTPAVTLGLTAGYANPEIDSGHLASQFALARDQMRAAFGRASLDARPAPDLSLHLSAYRLDQRDRQLSQEDGTFAPWGDLFQDATTEERNAGAQARAVWSVGEHTLVVGADYAHAAVNQEVEAGEFLQSLGLPARFETEPSIDRWGVYANDTVTVGPLTLTPGLRYDGTSQTDAFWSPSFGATLKAAQSTLFRASVARGFALPPLSYMIGGTSNLDPNPDLEPEKIWSYQAGVETVALRVLWLKITAFRHEATGSLEAAPSSGPVGVKVENRGHAWRTGFEAEAETASWRGTSLRAGFAYVRVEKSGDLRDQDLYQVNSGLAYNRGSLHAELFGHFVWWDLGPGSQEGAHNDFLWDLNARKTFFLEGLELDLFATLHNLFNGDQQWDTDRGNEPRWAEGGLRLRF